MGTREKRKDRRIHREQDKADRGRHDNKQHRARERDGERERNTGEETIDGPRYMPGGTRESCCSILWTEGSCTCGIKRSWAIAIASK